MNNKKFAKKLKDLLDEKEITQRELCKRLDITESAFSNYMQGIRLPRLETLKAIAKALDTNVDYLLDLSYIEKPINEDTFKMPIINEVRAGMPTLISEENTINYEELTIDYKSKGELFGLNVKGDSMYPEIQEKDLLIVQRTADVESGSICIVLINGDEATVKKVKKTSSGIMLIPFNQAYETKFYSNDDIISLPVIIIGKVIEVRRKF